MKFLLIIILTFLKFEIVAANEKIAFIDLNIIFDNSKAGKEIIQTNDFIALLDKTITQMTPEKSRTSCD